ncbi:Calcium channel subunit mid1, partial [Globisporangium splendens]
MLQRSLLLLGVLIFLSAAIVHQTKAGENTNSNNEEPKTSVCRRIAENSLAFCSMVDYVAVVDEDDPDGANFDAKARFYYENVNAVLQRFGCHAKYSLYDCDDCRDAYKYWICSIKFQKRGYHAQHEQGGDEPDHSSNNLDDYHAAICAPSSNAVTSTAETCANGAASRHRTCLSICKDVVRKCPYVLNFQCPTLPSCTGTSSTTHKFHELR